MNTQYLNPLNDFIRHHKPLCIFSTNYDACVEKFCQDNNKDLVDGNLYDALPAAIAIKPNFVNGFYDYRMLINIKTGMNVLSSYKNWQENIKTKLQLLFVGR